MPSTLNFTWPYPATTDSPNGPAQLKSLADAADATVKTVKDTAERSKYTVEVSKSSLQSIGTGATILLFDTDITDVQNMHSTVSNTGRLVAPIAGRYEVKAWAVTSSQTSGVWDMWIRPNGSGELWRNRMASLTVATNYMATSGSVFLAASEYVEILAQISGGAENTVSPYQRAVMRYVGSA